jgi:hypothetical protein
MAAIVITIRTVYEEVGKINEAVAATKDNAAFIAEGTDRATQAVLDRQNEAERKQTITDAEKQLKNFVNEAVAIKKEYQSLPAWKYEPPLFATPYTASILYLEGPYLITGKFIKSLIKNVPHIKKLVVGPKTVVDLNGYDQSVQKELEDASSNKVREFSLILMPRSIVLSETLDQALSIYKIEIFNEKTLPKFSQFVSNNFHSKNLQLLSTSLL